MIEGKLTALYATANGAVESLASVHSSETIANGVDDPVTSLARPLQRMAFGQLVLLHYKFYVVQS